MQTYQVYCEGVRPLLMNPVSDELLESLRTKVTKPKRIDWTKEEEAATKIYTRDGVIGIPVENLFSCLAEAGRQVILRPKVQISTKTSTLMPSFMTLLDEFLPLVVSDGNGGYHPSTKWSADLRRGRNPGDGVLVAIVRPKFELWGFLVTVEIDEKTADANKVRILFEVAGKSIGLCDFRPSCKGMFGTFKVVKWEQIGGESNSFSSDTQEEALSEEEAPV